MQEMEDALDDDILNLGDQSEGHGRGDPTQIDDEVGVHWQGDSVQDGQEMDDAFDDILNLGDL